jgi:hypothetical protein
VAFYLVELEDWFHITFSLFSSIANKKKNTPGLEIASQFNFHKVAVILLALFYCPDRNGKTTTTSLWPILLCDGLVGGSGSSYVHPVKPKKLNNHSPLEH